LYKIIFDLKNGSILNFVYEKGFKDEWPQELEIFKG